MRKSKKDNTLEEGAVRKAIPRLENWRHTTKAADARVSWAFMGLIALCSIIDAKMRYFRQTMRRGEPASSKLRKA